MALRSNRDRWRGDGELPALPWGGVRQEFWMAFAASIVRPLSTVLTRRDWRGREHVPPAGGVIVACNHVSHIDPVLVAHYVYSCGRLPRFLAKAELFRLRFAGRVVRGSGQIPVLRRTPDAAQSLAAAVAAVQRGECLVIYPEGTITRDPEHWPMRARTGVARLALLTGAPVIPVAQWGAQDILGLDMKLHLWKRRTVRVLAGPPADLSRWSGAAPDAAVLRDVTDAIMGLVRDQVGLLRGAAPPERVWDPQQQRRKPAESSVPPAGAASPETSASPERSASPEGAAPDRRSP